MSGLVKHIVEQKDVNTGKVVHTYEYDDYQEALQAYGDLSDDPAFLTSLEKRRKTLLTENV